LAQKSGYLQHGYIGMAGELFQIAVWHGLFWCEGTQGTAEPTSLRFVCIFCFKKTDL
jgi:hypothetical protein